MSAVKLCGMSRKEDIEVINEIKPEYIGFVFFAKSKRYVSDEKARELRSYLTADTKVAGVFLDDDMDHVATLANEGVIDIIQLHGHEDEEYIKKLKEVTTKPIIRAFVVKDENDIKKAEESSADMVLLDSGTGSGKTFDWSLLKEVKRDYFLAGGLDPDNVRKAVEAVHPYAVDVSSGIETDGVKDAEKMRRFVEEVRDVG